MHICIGVYNDYLFNVRVSGDIYSAYVSDYQQPTDNPVRGRSIEKVFYSVTFIDGHVTFTVPLLFY